MKSLVRHIVLTLCFLLSCTVCAQGGQGGVFSLDEGVDGTWRVVYRTGSLTVQPDIEGYSRLVADGATVANGPTGHPALPSASRLVLLPRGSRLSLGPVVADSEVRAGAVPEGRPLHPVVGPWPKESAWPGYQPDAKVYGAARWYRAGEPLELEHVGTMGRHEVYRLTVHPVAYHPVRRSLEVCTRIEASLALLPGDGAPLPAGRREGYLVVSRPQFREGLQPFVRWKRQQGFEVTEVYADTNRREYVKPLVDAAFAAADGGLRYVLLVGDAAQLQSFVGTVRPSEMSQHITDLYYVEQTGDYLPDALVGRWPVNDTAELGAVVRKTLAYEQGRLADSAALRRLLLVAGAEATLPAPTTTNGQVNYVGREVKLSHPEVDTLCYRNPASGSQREAILAALRQGVAALNYTAHCTEGGWSSPSVSFAGIDTLGLRQPLLYVNNCCLSNNFGGTCFGEQLLRAPEGGAIGVVGATNSTLWSEDYYWAVGPKYPASLDADYDSLRPGAFDRWLGRAADVRTQGELLAAGNLAVTAFGSPYDKFYWEIYCLLGDPSLEPWVGVPPVVALTADTVRHGDARLALGGTAGATVTAMQADTLLACGTIGPDGHLSLLLNRSVDTLPLVLAATLGGHRPRLDTVAVLPAVGRAVALRAVAPVADSALTFRIENVGTLPLGSLRVRLCQPQADSATDALLAVQQVVVGPLQPGEGEGCRLPLQWLAVGQTPWWEALLAVCDSVGDTLCGVGVQGRLEVQYPTAAFRLLDAEGSASRSLEPQRSYRLEVLPSGLADSLTLRVAALPSDDVLIDTVLHSPLSTLHFPLSTPDTLTHLRLQASQHRGNHRTVYDHYLVAGQRMDGFEAGMASYPWQGGGTQPWRLDSAVVHGGRYSLRSGAIGHQQTSDLVLEVWLPVIDTLSYWSRISSEPNADKLLFTVDGVSRASDRWGDGNWKQVRVALDAGRHTLRWRYVKDASDQGGSDCAWVDDVRLPMALWAAPYGWFGSPEGVGIEPAEAPQEAFTVYPNPTQGRLGWTAEGVESIRVVDLYGRELLCLVRPLPQELDLSHLPDGVYLLQAATAHHSFNKKIIICH